MTLYELTEQIRILSEQEWVDPDTGEILDEDVANALNTLTISRDEKIENIGLWIKDTLAEAEAIKEEKRKLEIRQRQKERLAESLKRYLDYVLAGQKFSSPRVAISFRNVVNGKTVIDDPTLIPMAFQKVVTEPIKSEISKAIKAGMDVPGAHLEDSHSVIVR
ncbi:MAG: siphovirus Gp157 family protein [Firmicutes bacterium]|nr:siphovirus Gp157 family protein [Bacillota bacterium]